MVLDSKGVIVYMSKFEKSQYIEKYLFLRPFIENENVTSIGIENCVTLPEMRNRFDMGGDYVDTYNESWHEFTEGKNVYRLQDVHFQSKHNHDYEFKLYIKEKGAED